MYSEKNEMVKPNEYMEINIGSLENMKIVNNGKGTSSEEMKAIEELIQEFKDVFSSSYDDLKAYKCDIILLGVGCNLERKK